jgi:hypothetical protein
MSSSSENPDVAPTKAVTIDLGPALWSSRKVPRLPAFNNQYMHIGDAYSRDLHTAEKWEIKDP